MLKIPVLVRQKQVDPQDSKTTSLFGEFLASERPCTKPKRGSNTMLSEEDTPFSDFHIHMCTFDAAVCM